MTQLDHEDRVFTESALETLHKCGKRQVLSDNVLKAVVSQVKGQDIAILKAALRTMAMLGKQKFFPGEILHVITLLQLPVPNRLHEADASCT